MTSAAKTLPSAASLLLALAACSSSPPAAAQLKLVLPAAAEADAPVDGTLTALDAAGAPVPGYVGTVEFSSTDASADLPAPLALAAADQGTKGVRVTFHAVGSYTVSVRDAAQKELRGKSDAVQVAVPPAAALKVENLQASADPGANVAFSLVAVTRTGAVATGYRGTVRFESTDATAAGKLPDAAFAEADAGRRSFTTQFGAAGAHTLTITDAAKPALRVVAGPVQVHGLVYTDPPAGTGKVRLVRNPGSGGAVVLLDLVAAAPLAGWAVGMNLPVDFTRVSPGAALMAAGTALDPGQAPQAFKAVAPSSGPLAGLLVSGLSQKAAGAGAKGADKALAAGDVLYTLRLEQKAGAQPGVVLDGQSLGPRFRAALRNKAGDDVATQAEFAIGKLEVL